MLIGTRNIPILINSEKNGTKVQSLDYLALSAVLVKEIQDLKKTINIDNCKNNGENITEIIYTGTTQLKNDYAIVNIDTDCIRSHNSIYNGRAFMLLCRNPRVYLQNVNGFTPLHI